MRHWAQPLPFPVPEFASPVQVHVLLFDPGSDQEGIHSIELGGRTVVLLFEDADDAERYAGLLEAQDFPVPSVEALDRREIEIFCQEAGYEARFVPAGFLPRSDEERLLIAPPERNMDVTNWKEQHPQPPRRVVPKALRMGQRRSPTPSWKLSAAAWSACCEHHARAGPRPGAPAHRTAQSRQRVPRRTRHR